MWLGSDCLLQESDHLHTDGVALPDLAFPAAKQSDLCKDVNYSSPEYLSDFLHHLVVLVLHLLWQLGPQALHSVG